MEDPLGISPSKGNQGATQGKEKILLTSVGMEPTTSGLDLPLLCRLSYGSIPTEVKRIFSLARVVLHSNQFSTLIFSAVFSLRAA